ncbi:dipeptidase [Mycoplasmatota bacterium WC44]
MIDLHCDTIMKLFFNKESSLKENNYHVDINKLRKSNSFLQCFAIFAPHTYLDKEGVTATNEYELVTQMADRFFEELEGNKEDILLVRNFSDINNNKKSGKISALLTIEGAGSIDSLERINEYYDMGVRLITLTWNFVNCIGYPNVDGHNDKGLTEFGLKAVKRMNELGIIVDVSHLSDGGFWDVVNHSTKPFVASHSNARAICPHDRNLTDDMIKALARKDGVIGVNFYPKFITNDLETNEMRVRDLVTQIKYIKDIGGIDCIALGTDFDGMAGDLEIYDIGEMDKLKIALKEDGFTFEEIEKIWYKNALRVMQETLK